jgi:hypothetical protein
VELTKTFDHVELTKTFDHVEIQVTFEEVKVEDMATRPKIEPFYKQPSESFVIAANYDTVLVDGETLLVGDCEITATDKNGADVTSSVISGKEVDGAYLKTTVLGDTEITLQPYKITFVAMTSLGNIFEVDAKMNVVNI